MMAILFDLDGVFYQGNKPVAGAAEVLAWLRENDIPHLFVTNTSSRPRRALVDMLANFAIHTDASRIFTPAVAAVRLLEQQQVNQKIALFVPEATQIEFSDFSIWHDGDAAAAAVIVGDLGEGWTFQVLNQAFRLLMKDPRPQLIALGMTRYWQASDGLRLDVAPFVIALEHASGVQAVVMGKPAKAFFTAAMDMLGAGPSETIMVGDDIHVDVEAAQHAGMHGILVKTGKFRPADLQQGIQPDAVLASVRDLPAWWQQYHQ